MTRFNRTHEAGLKRSRGGKEDGATFKDNCLTFHDIICVDARQTLVTSKRSVKSTVHTKPCGALEEG